MENRVNKTPKHEVFQEEDSTVNAGRPLPPAPKVKVENRVDKTPRHKAFQEDSTVNTDRPLPPAPMGKVKKPRKISKN